ncbi:MAG TPA: LuxR C-terminal-related transcriptional regulator, partial [Chloroflexota bacterium]|nr:LuxR C-terminal-related transcriptional regulator [Chloroflexota bacterium]
PEHGWRAACEAHLALLCRQPLRARCVIEEALSTARRLGLFDLEMVAVAQDGLALVMNGDAEEGMRRLDEVMTAVLSSEIADHRAVAITCGYMVLACSEVQDLDRFSQWSSVLGQSSTLWRCPPILSRCRIEYADLLMLRGQWSQAEDELEASRGEPADGVRAAYAQVALAELRRRQGRYEDAQALLRQAAPSPGRRMIENQRMLTQAKLLLDQGDPTAAREIADRLRRGLPANHVRNRVDALQVLVTANVRQGEPERASAALSEMTGCVTGITAGGVLASARVAEGLVAAAATDLDAARHHFEDGLALFEDVGAPFEAALARLELGDTLMCLGRTAAAADETSLAITALQQLGVVNAGQRAEALLHRLASQTSRHTNSSTSTVPPDLTRRELEVLRLLAIGRTNRQIASELFLSVRTVERHLSNIYRTLGMSGKAGRRAAAIAALEAGLAGPRGT